MNEFYNPESIEKYVQKYWDENKTFEVTECLKKKKYYCLSMMPYPSGSLHMGHVRNYTIGDVIARYQRMLGKNVLHPIGWDAFGLPAENAAIKNNILPNEWTLINIKYMKKQLKMLGLSYDWNREIITCEPSYYKWEQWFFIELYKKKLAYKKKSLVNWCPNDQTVLANEQVIDDNICWRCGTKVKKKNIMQWFIKITKYADELFYGLDNLKYWPEKVKNMQRNWIGRVEGIEINFEIINFNKKKIKIFINNPKVLLKKFYIILSISNKLSIEISKKNKLLFKFIKENIIKNKKNIENNQINYNIINTNLYTINPLNGKYIPILIGNFLPCENNKYKSIILEFDFDKHNNINNISNNCIFKNYFNNIKENKKKNKISKNLFNKKDLTSENKNNNFIDNININSIIDKLESIDLCKRLIKYRLRDWCISRQRYWGTPIPMLILKKKNIIPVPNNQLPVTLPEKLTIDNFCKKIKIETNYLKTFYKGISVLRESDTFDTFIESSWYYLRYTCPNYNKNILDSSCVNYWLPVDQYIGGIEHATMHLIYFRFFHKLLRDFGFVSIDEPVKKLLCQGMVVSESFYYISDTGERIWVSPNDAIIKRDKNNKIIKATDHKNRELIYGGISKMSKSKNNGIDPEKIIKKYGADTLRLFIMFASPVEMSLEWRESGIKGIYRFLQRLWDIVYKHVNCGIFNEQIDISLLTYKQKNLYFFLQKTIIKVTNDIENGYKFNTAISSIMKLLNQLTMLNPKNKIDFILQNEVLITIIKIMYPFTPHICFILWKLLKNNNYIDNVLWPVANKKIFEYFSDINNTIIIQINGKLRGSIIVPFETNKIKIFNIIIKKPLIIKHLFGLVIKKIIYIPGKLINLVVN